MGPAGIVKLGWSPLDLRIIWAEPPNGCSVGQPIDLALGILPAEARDLTNSALGPLAASPHFLRSNLESPPTILRLEVGNLNGEPWAWVMDLNQLLKGAPQIQFSSLSSHLSHELRNPLSSVKMAVQTLARHSTLGEKDQRRIAIAEREIRTLERTLWMVSEFGGAGVPNLEPTSLKAVIDQALERIEPELAFRKVTCIVAADPADGAPIPRLDPHRLAPVLSQLFLNAALGLAPDSTLNIEGRFNPDGFHEICVEDACGPLPELDKEKMFSPYSSPLARGSGLSLAALQNTVLSQGGRIILSSSERGVEFKLRFPA